MVQAGRWILMSCSLVLFLHQCSKQECYVSPVLFLGPRFPCPFPRTNSLCLYLTQVNSSKHWGNFKSGNWLRICKKRWGSPWWEEKTRTGYGPLLWANPRSQPGTRNKLSSPLGGLSLAWTSLGHCLCEAFMDLHVSTWNSRLQGFCGV